MLGGYGTCGRPLCCTTFLHVVRAGLDQDGEAAGPEPQPVEAVRAVRPAEVLPALRAAERQRASCTAAAAAKAAATIRPAAAAAAAVRRLRQLAAAARLRTQRMTTPTRRLAQTSASRLQRIDEASIAITAAIPPASVRRSRRAPRPIRACSPCASRSSTAAPDAAAFSPGVLSARRRTRGVRRDRARGRRRPARRRRRDRDGAGQQGSVPAGRAAVDRPHRSARAPHRRAARRDDVLLRARCASCWRRCTSRWPRCRALLTRESLEATIALTARELPRFGIAAPRIAVAGLNPHAGEHGLFGREEEDGDRAGDRGVPRARHRRRRARFPAIRCSSAPVAASSTSSSPAITIRD